MICIAVDNLDTGGGLLSDRSNGHSILGGPYVLLLSKNSRWVAFSTRAGILSAMYNWISGGKDIRSKEEIP